MMEIRVFIVSLACLSYLVPPALGKVLVAKAAAIGAVKGAIIGGIKGAAIGAKVGLAAKGGLALLAKKALLGVLLKAVVAKAPGLLAAKKSVAKSVGSLALNGVTEIMNATGMISSLVDRSSSNCPPSIFRSPLMRIVSGTATVVRSALSPCGEAQPAPIVYRIVPAAPRIVPVPLV